MTINTYYDRILRIKLKRQVDIMLQETKELLKGFYGLDDETFKLSEEVMNDIKHKFDEIKEIREYNQYIIHLIISWKE